MGSVRFITNLGNELSESIIGDELSGGQLSGTNSQGTSCQGTNYRSVILVYLLCSKATSLRGNGIMESVLDCCASEPGLIPALSKWQVVTEPGTIKVRCLALPTKTCREKTSHAID